MVQKSEDMQLFGWKVGLWGVLDLVTRRLEDSGNNDLR